jgi:hypothetical protein
MEYVYLELFILISEWHLSCLLSMFLLHNTKTLLKNYFKNYKT